MSDWKSKRSEQQRKTLMRDAESQKNMKVRQAMRRHTARTTDTLPMLPPRTAEFHNGARRTPHD